MAYPRYPEDAPLHAGICTSCLYKAGIILLVIMVSISAIILAGIL